MKKRFIILNISILLIVIASLVYIAIAGDYYDYRTGIYAEDPSIADKVNIEMKCDNEGILEMNGRYVKDDYVYIKLHSAGTGEVNVSFTETNRGYYMADANFRVGFLGTIIETTDGRFNFNGYMAVVWQIMAIILLTGVIMIFSFLECRKKNMFSYSMISYGGIALFDSMLFLYPLYKILNNVVNSFADFLALVTETGVYFCLALAPVVLILSVSLTLSNISLMRHEGYRPVNALGIVISVLWVVGLMFVLDFGVFSIIWIPYFEALNSVKMAVTYVLIYFECMLLSTMVCAYMASRHRPPLDRDYIIILGCAIRGDGSLTPLLRGRADSAIDFEREQYEKTGKHACFVPSGGRGPDEVISEGEAIERYLIDKGVPAERILREDKSVNTMQNMRFSKKVIQDSTDDFDSKKIAFSTTNYHVFRGYILSKKNGFEAQGISAGTKWYFFPNAFIREFIGLLYDQRYRHIVFVIIIFLVCLSDKLSGL